MPGNLAFVTSIGNYHGYQAVAPLRLAFVSWYSSAMSDYHGYQAVAPLRRALLAAF